MKKGFTLIELLAVIIILGILMLIAIPSVTNYINNARKESYVSTAKELVRGTSTMINNGDIETFDTNTTYYIPCNCIETETGTVSPYGDFNPAYVAVTYDGESYKYYWMSRDTEGVGVKDLTLASSLEKEKIISGIKAGTIKPTTGVGNRDLIKVLDETDCKTLNNGKLKKTITDNGEVEELPVSETIYWALQDNDTNGTNETLILSNQAVTGTYSGSFNGNTKFNSENSVPWGTSESLQKDVTTVSIDGKIAPKYTSYWFYRVGYNVTSSVNANLSNLVMNNVVDMSYMFYYFGYNASSCNLSGINRWNTSEVTNMNGAFSNYANHVSTFNLDLSSWDLSKVQTTSVMFDAAGGNSNSFTLDVSEWDLSSMNDLSCIFRNTGQNSSTYRLIGLETWDTSHVSNMVGVFWFAGMYATNWSIGDVSGWNVSNVKDMHYMFTDAGYYADSFVMDLSSWNVSNLEGSVYMMFGSAGHNSRTFDLKLNNWDLSKVTNMHDMFGGAGNCASNSKIELKNWKIRSNPDMTGMFSNFGYNSGNVRIDLSGWDMTGASSMKDMFLVVGASANNIYIDASGLKSGFTSNFTDMFLNIGWRNSNSNITIIIPSTNGNGLNNTTTKMYGIDSSSYAIPPDGATFSLAT